jgi:hypothetical protein
MASNASIGTPSGLSSRRTVSGGMAEISTSCATRSVPNAPT